MSIRSRLAILVSILVTLAVVILGYLLFTFVDTRGRLSQADTALREYEFAINTDANLARFRLELLDYLAGDGDVPQNQFHHYVGACLHSFEGWLASSEASVRAGIEDEEDDVAAVRELRDHFQTALETSYELIELHAAGSRAEAQSKKREELHPFFENVVGRRIERITAEEDLELNGALNGVLLSMGSTPWIAWIGPAQLDTARATLSEIHAAHHTRSQLLNQMYRLADFLAGNPEDSLRHVAAATLTLEEAAGTWGLATHNYARVSGEEALPHFSKFMQENAKFQHMVAEVISLAQDGRLGEAREMAQRELKPALDHTLLDTVDESLNTEMEEFRGMLRHVQASTGAAGAAGIAVIVLVLLAAVGLFLSTARPMLSALEKLHTGTKIIGRGNLEHRVGLTTHDELGMLGASFDAMAENLRTQVDRREALEKELLRNERLATLGQVIATVSHEIRNPLGTIRTSLYSIRKRLAAVEEPVERALDRAERSIVRCDTIIEELLDFTRTRTPNLVETQLDNWLAGVLEDYSPPESIHFSSQLTSGETLKLDRSRIQGCVVNLLNNACQAMMDPVAGPGCGELRVETRRENDRIEIRVYDTGPGVSDKELKRVFEPMYSTRSFGVGLGLAIVKKYMEAHGGGAEISPRPGGGTVATLWFSH